MNPTTTNSTASHKSEIALGASPPSAPADYPSTIPVDIPSARPLTMDLLLQLEISLRISQQALLSRNLNELESQSAVQLCLRNTLSECLRHSCGDDLELSALSARLLQNGRIQVALLLRAQRSLRVLSNILASSQMRYEARAAAPAIWTSIGRKEG